jgi:hypothetical protein
MIIRSSATSSDNASIRVLAWAKFTFGGFVVGSLTDQLARESGELAKIEHVGDEGLDGVN